LSKRKNITVSGDLGSKEEPGPFGCFIPKIKFLHPIIVFELSVKIPVWVTFYWAGKLFQQLSFMKVYT